MKTWADKLQYKTHSKELQSCNLLMKSFTSLDVPERREREFLLNLRLKLHVGNSKVEPSTLSPYGVCLYLKRFTWKSIIIPL